MLFRSRLVLMDKLYQYATNPNFDEKTRLRLSYELLSGVAKFKEFAPCLKRYLYSHLRTKFIEVPADQWEVALFLPVEQFIGAKITKVHSDSRAMIRQGQRK